jgi:putative transposase
MIVLEYKVRVNKIQAEAIDEAIRIGQFIQNKCLRLWMEQPGLTRYDLNGYCKVLAEEYPFAKALNSMARQASAERTWCAISRFYRNCRQNKPGKKDIPNSKSFVAP